MRKLLRAMVLIALAGAPAPARADGPEVASADSVYWGEYVLDSGQPVSVYQTGVITALAHLAFINWENDRIGPLQADGDDRFWSPRSAAESDVRQTEIVFQRDEAGRVRSLTIAEAGSPPVVAERRERFRSRPAAIANGEVVLAGTCKVPVGGGPFPGVVLVHGSGPGTREQLEGTARFFTHLGLAVVSYDKRGCGGSSGDWKRVDLEALADDALAAVAWLAAQPEVDPARVGIWGISQGGWVAPLAASRGDKVAFVINHSGPGTSLRRQDLTMITNALADEGVTAAEIALVAAAFDVLYDYGQGKATAAQLDAAVAPLREMPEFAELGAYSARDLVPDSLYARQAIGDPAWFFHLDPDRDALAPYRRLRCPVLVVYGQRDRTIPVAESVTALTAVLRETGHPDWRIEVLERTGHGPVVVEDATPPRPAVPTVVASEYYRLLAEWLQPRVLAGR